MEVGTFSQSPAGFERFTQQAQRVVKDGEIRQLPGDRKMYYLKSARDPEKGVVVFERNGKLDSMMASNRRYFTKQEAEEK